MNTLTQLFQNFAVTCQPKGDFLGFFPTWYKYLDGNNVNGSCIPKVAALNDVWLIVAAVTDMLLRIAVMVSIAFIVVGGVKYITSQGMSDKTAKARDTIIQAVIGLVISLGAATILTYIAGQL